MYKAICKNEEERFSLVRVKYDGNMPKIIEEIYFRLLSPTGDNFALEQLDYGATGITLTKQEIVESLQALIDNKSIPKWQIGHCKMLIKIFTNHEDEAFMYVEYEI